MQVALELAAVVRPPQQSLFMGNSWSDGMNEGGEQQTLAWLVRAVATTGSISTCPR